MADMHWFRWHHGTVTDPKFGLIAKKAGTSVAEVIAIWAYLLEAASASEERGHPGTPDFESIDFALGVDEGTTARVYGLMQDRALIDCDTGRLAAWERRQPKRERDDDTGAERKRRQREREAAGVTAVVPPSHTESISVTPCHATSRQVTPRGEERRRDKRTPPYPPQAGEVGGDEPKTTTKAGTVCKAIRAKGVTDVSPSHPKLRALIDKGVGVETFAQAAEICTRAHPVKGMGYLLGIVERQLREAADIGERPGMSQAAWDHSRASIEAKAEALGIGRWREFNLGPDHEHWPAYFRRVKNAVECEARGPQGRRLADREMVSG
ncbi:hypothetical protein EJP69_23670 [Variovorax gossypii]|uniref:DUF1376 domain-containing protein n=1 Tax=Variovorax gossypii TaxID=1679495 RepID=A0A3S0GYQ3_9BURK|nr:hypothetical protein [Variovorax gossypii]RTQ32267.1 hypothetical protein EJP69_23670 [Variovorax gossypii]